MTDKTLNAAQLAEIICWTEEVRKTQCSSFVDVALRHPAIWAALRLAGIRRRVFAQACGWSLRLNTEAIRTLSAAELGTVLLNQGHENAAEFWVDYQSMCNRMHHAGKLDAALAFVRSSLQVEPNEVVPDSEAAELDGGYLQAWLLLDPEGARETHKRNGLDNALKTLSIMPPEGWPTTGGHVGDLPDLIIARLLESARIAFEAPGAMRAVINGDRHPDAFRLLRHHVVIRVCSAASFAEVGSAEMMPRTVLIDRGLIESEAHLVCFVHHLIESLLDAGVQVYFDKPFSYSSLVQPNSLSVV